MAKATQKMSTKTPVSHGVGRRKSAIARVWLRPGSGVITVNGRKVEKYFDTSTTAASASSPMRIIPAASAYDVDVNVAGGGLWGQADAVKLGIARALVEIDGDIRTTLREHGLLTVDSRLKERKKYGQRGARRKFQFVKR